MATVKATLERLANDPRGQTLLADVLRDFETRDWPTSPPAPTRAQLHGVDDVGPPSDNSPDWIDLVPGLGPQTRKLLRSAYDRAVSRP